LREQNPDLGVKDILKVEKNSQTGENSREAENIQNTQTGEKQQGVGMSSQAAEKQQEQGKTA
jgi:hypothetical protein